MLRIIEAGEGFFFGTRLHLEVENARRCAVMRKAILNFGASRNQARISPTRSCPARSVIRTRTYWPLLADPRLMIVMLSTSAAWP